MFLYLTHCFTLTFSQCHLINFSVEINLQTGFPHLFISIFQGLFQDFPRSKLRFSRTIIFGKKNALGDRNLQEKYSILILYVFLKGFQDFSRTLLFSQELSRPGNLLFHFPSFLGCVGTLFKCLRLYRFRIFLQKLN